MLNRIVTFLKDPSFHRPLVYGFSFCGVLVFYRMIPQNLLYIHIVFGILLSFYGGVWLHRRFGANWHQTNWPWIVAFGYLSLSLGFDFKVFFFYLGSYYPYPPPTHANLHFFTMVTAVFAYAALNLSFGGRAAFYYEQARLPRQTLAAGFFGLGLGILFVNLILFHNWPVAVFTSLFLLALMIPRNRTGVAVATLLVCFSIGIYLKQSNAVYLGSLQDAVLEKQVDSPYTRTHFFTYHDRQCVTIDSNYHPITFNCRNPELLPRGLTYFFQFLVGERSNYRALVVGRSLGMYPNILLSVNPQAEVIQTADFDPQITRQVEKNFSFTDLDDRSAGKRKIRYFAGDLSRFMLDHSESYDIVFYNGIGLAQYQVPFCLHFQEYYLLTPEVLNRLFYVILPPDGVFIMDWGGSISKEPLYMLANFPADVDIRIFWYDLIEPPFTGMPLFYIVASRDSARLDALEAHLKKSSFFTRLPRPQARTLEFSLPQLLAKRLEIFRDFYSLIMDQNAYLKTSWDRPFCRYDMILTPLFFLFLLAVLIGAAIFFFLIMLGIGRAIVAVGREIGLLWRQNTALTGLKPWIKAAAVLSTEALLAVFIMSALLETSRQKQLSLVVAGLLALFTLLILFRRLPAAGRSLVDSLLLFIRRYPFLLYEATVPLWRTRPRFLFLNPLRRPTIAYFTGIMAVIWFIDVAGRQSHQLIGIGYTWPIFIFIWLTAAASALLMLRRAALSWAPTAGLSLLAVAAVTTGNLNLEGLPALIPVILTGWLTGATVRLALPAEAAEDRQAGWHAFFSGIAIGFVACQILQFFVGFSVTADVSLLILLLVLWRLWMGRRQNLAG